MLPVVLVIQSCNMDYLTVNACQVLSSAVKLGLDANQFFDLLTKTVLAKYMAESESEISPEALKLVFISMVFDVYAEPVSIEGASIIDELRAGARTNVHMQLHMFTPMENSILHLMEETVWYCFSKAHNKRVDFGGKKLLPIQMVSYLLTLSMRWDSSYLNRFLSELDELLESVNDEDAFCCASLLSATNAALGYKYKELESFEKYLELFDDIFDSVELEKFRFEEDICACANAIASEWTELAAQLDQRLSCVLDDLSSGDPEKPPKLDSVTQKLKSEFAFLQASVTDNQNRVNDRERLLQGFENEMKTIGGPWHDDFLELHFKALNRISLHGKRVLMSLNHHFTRHEAAVRESTETVQHPEEPHAVERVLKPMTFETAEGEMERFRCSVKVMTMAHEYDVKQKYCRVVC